MSSPLAIVRRGLLRRSLVGIHRAASHSRRVEILARCIADLIARQFPGQSVIRCLDVGCGDMTLAERISYYHPAIDWRCLDIHPLSTDLPDRSRWEKYGTFNGRDIPIADDAFDLVMFCDVLHHSRTDAAPLLREARRVGSMVLVKDHFQDSGYSRLMLRIMDFVGNWGYGIALPDDYFTPDSFTALHSAGGLRHVELIRGIDPYAHLPLVRTLLRPSWQFIALLARVERDSS